MPNLLPVLTCGLVKSNNSKSPSGSFARNVDSREQRCGALDGEDPPSRRSGRSHFFRWFSRPIKLRRLQRKSSPNQDNYHYDPELIQGVDYRIRDQDLRRVPTGTSMPSISTRM